MKSQVFKNIFLLIGLLILISITVFLYRRNSIEKIIYKSEMFVHEKTAYIDSLQIFYHDNLQELKCDKVNLGFNWKNKYLDIGCLDSSYEFISRIDRPIFIKEFFLDNDGNSILFSRDGILFYTLYHSYGFKKFSLKYFFNQHKLRVNDIYLGKYKVVDKVEFNNKGFNCIIIDKYWLLISRDEKK
jgi:hypothetical protein